MKIKRSFRFHYGLIECDPLEKQARDQGMTLGDRAKPLQALAESAVILRFSEVLTESEYVKVMRRINRQVVEALRGIER